jgi:hypothetical protein
VVTMLGTAVHLGLAFSAPGFWVRCGVVLGVMGGVAMIEAWRAGVFRRAGSET